MRVTGSAYSERMKRVLDLTILVVTHLLLLPFWLLVWILIPLAIVVDTGFPVFYRTRRVGKDGEVFEPLKFRTMVQEAEQQGPSITYVGDDRITAVGRLLRKTALDELPQLLCILRGTMSFVGPRPLGVETHRIWTERVPGFEDRLEVLPGLTGLTAVYGDPNDYQRRLELERRYIETRSPWLDLKLLFVSAWIALCGNWERNKPKEERLRAEIELRGEEPRIEGSVKAETRRRAEG